MDCRFSIYSELQPGDIFSCNNLSDKIVGIIIKKNKFPKYICIKNKSSFYKIGKIYEGLPWNYSSLEIISK